MPPPPPPMADQSHARLLLQILEIGDRQDAQLTPSKLAAFYKAVGGDYDCSSRPLDPLRPAPHR